MASRQERRAQRQEEVAQYKAMSRKERRQARRQSDGGGKGKGKKSAEDYYGNPLGGGQAFDNDPNTMFSYYNAPQNFNFADTAQYGGAPGDFNDPYNVYLSAIPEMQRQTTSQINDALAAVGGTGNRYSSTAFDTAGRIGADSAERQNAMLSQMLYQQTNQDLDRQMAAAMGMINASPQVEDAFQSRFGINMQLANQEQRALAEARANQLARERMSYQDFQNNRYGNLPFLTQFLSNSIGQGPEPIVRTSGGSPGYGADITRLLTALMAS